MYEAIQERIAAYEREIMRKLAEMEREECRGKEAPKLNNPNKAKAIKKRGEEPLRQALYRISGVDLTGIDAIGVETVQLVIGEYGTDLSMFPTEKQFVSHITLAPHKPTSGGKPVKKRKKRGSASSRVAAGLRMAALSLRHSQTALGASYRHIAARKGGGRGGVCPSPKAGHADLPPATLGAALPGRGSRRIRKTVPGRPFQTPGCQRQGPWLSTNDKGRHGLSLSRSSEESQIRNRNNGVRLLSSLTTASAAAFRRPSEKRESTNCPAAGSAAWAAAGSAPGPRLCCESWSASAVRSPGCRPAPQCLQWCGHLHRRSVPPPPPTPPS